MKLRGIEFGNVLGASGVQGFYGEGYWFHTVCGPKLEGITFVSKTATLHPRAGNMLLKGDYTPVKYFPDCVKGNLWREVMLNAVGLSNPGLELLLASGKWQKRTKPFFISIMTLSENTEERLEEISRMVQLIGEYHRGFSAPFALQINESCPNTGDHDPAKRIGTASRVLEIASVLGVPLMLKYSIASAIPEAIMSLNDDPHCDAICVSNTIPFGWVNPNDIEEKKNSFGKKIWGSNISPLAKYGGGGLSGSALLPLVTDWIMRLRHLGFKKPINGGGGILYPKDVEYYKDAGASSIFLGTVIPFASFLPFRYRVGAIVKAANTLDWG